MKRFVRLYALGFAVVSVIFWQGVITLGEIVPELQRVAYNSEPGMFQNWLLIGLPSIIYGVLCVLFCHRFATNIALKLKSE